MKTSGLMQFPVHFDKSSWSWSSPWSWINRRY